ncbi:hypothetical protein LCGC14_1874300 [marine sediment metagenome]|uniref:Uncharacterized protein n=1 Tax=marine sediment metagenome TaxID=412755 RepID=A0A0F9G416_9ZZZZ|nr:hypothetical protein [Candidatus Scalindua sediminis]HDY67319.1 hypothetical protein [Candidatus Scalindua sp.]
MGDAADDNLERLMAKIEVEQGLLFLKGILPQCMDLQNLMAKLMRNFYTSLCREGFTESQALEIIKTHATGLNANLNGEF